MDHATKIFCEIKQKLVDHLPALGFALVEDRYFPEAFGSRDATFRREMEAIRLLWDGREGWFILQSCAHADKEPWQDWKDIDLQSFDQQTDGDLRAQEIVDVMTSSLSKQLESPGQR